MRNPRLEADHLRANQQEAKFQIAQLPAVTDIQPLRRRQRNAGGRDIYTGRGKTAGTQL